MSNGQQGRDYSYLQGVAKSNDHKKKLSIANKGKVFLTKDGQRKSALPGSQKYNDLIADGWQIVLSGNAHNSLSQQTLQCSENNINVYSVDRGEENG